MRFRFKLTPTNLNLSFLADPQDVAGSVHFNVLQTPQRQEFQFMYDSNVSFSSSTVPNAEVDSDYNDSTYADYAFPSSSFEVPTDNSISEEITGQPDASEPTISNEYRASYGSTHVGHSDNLETIDSAQSIAQIEPEPQSATSSDDSSSPSEQSAHENDDPAELEPATLATATPPAADLTVRQPSPEISSRTLTAREIILAMIGHHSVTRDACLGNGTQALTPGQAAGRLILDLIQPSKLTPGQAAGRLILDLIKPKSSIDRETLDIVKNRVSSVSSDPAIVGFARAHEAESEQPAGSSSTLTQENDSSSEILIQKHRSASAPIHPSAPVRHFYRFSSFAINCTDAIDYFACKAPHSATPNNDAQTHCSVAAASQPAEIKVDHQPKSSKRVKKSYGEIESSIAATTTEEDSTSQPEFDPHSDLPTDHVHSLVQKFEAQQATIPDPKFLHSKFYHSRISSRSTWSGSRENVVDGRSQEASEPNEPEKADEPEPIADGPSEAIQEDHLSGSAPVSTGMQLVLRHEVRTDNSMGSLNPWSYEYLRSVRRREFTPLQIQPRVVVPDDQDNSAPVFRRIVLPGWVARALQPSIWLLITRELALSVRGPLDLLAPPELSSSRELVLHRSSSRQTPPALLPAPEPVSDRQLVLYRQSIFEAALLSSPEPVRDRGFVLYRALTVKRGLLTLPAPFETHDRELEQEKAIAAAAPTTSGASHIDTRPSLTLNTELAISSMEDSSPATESSSLEPLPFSSPSLPASSPASSVPSPNTVLEKPEPFSKDGTEETASHDDEMDYEMDYSPEISDEIEYRGEGDSLIHSNYPSDWNFPDYEQVLDGPDGSHYQISDMEPVVSIFLIDESTIPW
ncbi:hypothetical protein BZA70DRAFT_294481 [Myxozyma melibiosi]|uniref:Uncharacterized protein n=1 Tax=Myxozyma melibiosi TaxID=54550 RepID=A0ABR1F8L7_9ASCO